MSTITEGTFDKFLLNLLGVCGIDGNCSDHIRAEYIMNKKFYNMTIVSMINRKIKNK